MNGCESCTSGTVCDQCPAGRWFDDSIADAPTCRGTFVYQTACTMFKKGNTSRLVWKIDRITVVICVCVCQYESEIK